MTARVAKYGVTTHQAKLDNPASLLTTATVIFAAQPATEALHRDTRKKTVTEAVCGMTA